MALVVFSIVTFSGAFLLPFFIRSPNDEGYTLRPPRSNAGFVTKMTEYRPDLLIVWFFGHFVYAGAMIFAPFVASFRFATVLVAFYGM
jgi:solute carrier family 45 protein 1/2/4